MNAIPERTLYREPHSRADDGRIDGCQADQYHQRPQGDPQQLHGLAPLELCLIDRPRCVMIVSYETIARTRPNNREQPMRTPRMTIRGLLIAIAVEGVVLGACISLPWLVVVPLATALVFVPQLIVVAVCSYLATREWRAQRHAGRWCRRGRIKRTAETASPEIWYIETTSRAVRPSRHCF